ncbi:unnamed protein product [Cylicocyclus nassatus]|uniref:Uncharacterized protein n=1 Tax=Cylicocyclus nassatus TaxID=53992 RepID=A0AA36GHB4_CYLNA|nr:unnamed protein product [Cylicocyclus nassatus]
MIQCDDFDPHPVVYRSFMASLSIVTPPLNAFAIYCITRKSTKQMGFYKWWLLMYQLSSCVFDFVFTILIVPVVFFPIPMGYADSLLARLISLNGHVALILFISCIPLLTVTCLYLFIYRCYVLLPHYHMLKMNKRGIIITSTTLLLIYCIPTASGLVVILPDQREAREWMLQVSIPLTTLLVPIMTLMYLFGIAASLDQGHIYLCIAFFFIYAIPTGAGLVNISPDQEEAKRWIVSTFSCAEPVVRMSIPRLHIYTPDSFERLLITVLVLVVMIAPIGLAILGSALYFLRGASHLSKKTRRLQQKFFFFLLVQVSVPGIAYALPVFFLVVLFITMEPKIKFLGNLSLIFMGFHGTVSSLSLILCNEPYRKFVVEILMNKWWPKKNMKTPLLVSFTRPSHQIPAQ